MFYNVLLEEVKEASDKEESPEEDGEEDFTDEFLEIQTYSSPYRSRRKFLGHSGL